MLFLAIMVLFQTSAALAKTIEPEDTEIERYAGRTLHATVGAYDKEDGTFTVTIYDYDRYDEDDLRMLAAGDTLLAGGRLYRITGEQMVGDTKVFLCDDGEEIYFERSYDDDDDINAYSTMDDRIFMKVVAVLQLPPAGNIVYEDYSDPDLDAEPVITEGLDAILPIQNEKQEYSIGFDSYSTTITLNENLEIVKIHQVFDVAQ